MVGLSKRGRRFLAGMLIAAAIGATFSLVSHFNLLYGMQLRSSDFLFRAADMHAGVEPDSNIVIVGIDDRSLEELGRFPSWPRSYHAQLIDSLAASGARVIVFDILFSEPSPDDEQLAASMKQAGNVILSSVYAFVTLNSAAGTEATTFGDAINPLKPLAESALAIGHANMLPDEDGVVRRVPLIIPGGKYNEPALSLTAVAKFLRRPQVIEAPLKETFLPFAGRSISIDSTNSMLINYIGDSISSVKFNTVSYADVLRGDFISSVFQDKIVLVGVTATGIGDTLWTPLGRIMNGVEIHASAADTILTNNFLKQAPSSFTIMSILLLALLCGLMALNLRTLWATLSAVSLCIVYILTAFTFFDRGIMLNMLYPPLAVLGTFVGVNLYNVVYERSEKMAVTRTFGRYISPPVVDRILAAMEEGELRLGGEEHEVTVAFADIRGFTAISEKMRPEELVRAVNVYLSKIIEAVLKHGGVINKFGGDSVMAIWNVPVECEGHALSAVKAAVSAQQAIKECQDSRADLPRMEFGISVNTGKAVAGNMGSPDRLEYSVIGDAVNTAARLASVTPGGKVWMGADTFAGIKGDVTAVQLAPLAVKGKSQPVQAYEVTAIRDSQANGRDQQNP